METEAMTEVAIFDAMPTATVLRAIVTISWAHTPRSWVRRFGSQISISGLSISCVIFGF